MFFSSGVSKSPAGWSSIGLGEPIDGKASAFVFSFLIIFVSVPPQAVSDPVMENMAQNAGNFVQQFIQNLPDGWNDRLRILIALVAFLLVVYRHFKAG